MISQNNDNIEILKEILKWIKVSSYREVEDFLKSVLDTDTKKLIYQISDSTNSTIEVVKKSKSSTGSVSDYWKLWKKIGIGETIDVSGGKRFKRIFDLDDFNLLPKQMKNQTKTTEKKL